MNVVADGQLLERNGSTVIGVDNTAPRVFFSPGLQNAALTGVKTLTSGTAFALYMGRAPKNVTSVTVRWRLTTKATPTVSWGEIAIATGAVVLAGNPTLTVRATTDISATVLGSPAAFSTTVTVNLAEGADIWILIGHATSGSAAIVRAATIADDLQIGYQASSAVRPSTIINTPTSFTLEGATVLPVLLGISF